jgi:glucose-6-phosphate isomerase
MKLKFGNNLVEPEVRWLEELHDVAYDTSWIENTPNIEVYYMYRDLYSTRRHKDTIVEHQLRYDITIIPPLKMGLEYVKTLGHYHPRITSDSSYTYPELYEVLAGEAHYLLQRPANGRPDCIKDVLIVRARKGDKVVVPPNYGHVTVNPSEKPLKMANWVCRSFKSVYEPYKLLHGGAYYELVSGKYIPNRWYEQTPDIKSKRPVEVPALGLVKERPIYDLIEDPHQLEFLVAPDKYASLFNKFIV